MRYIILVLEIWGIGMLVYIMGLIAGIGISGELDMGRIVQVGLAILSAASFIYSGLGMKKHAIHGWTVGFLILFFYTLWYSMQVVAGDWYALPVVAICTVLLLLLVSVRTTVNASVVKHTKTKKKIK